MALNSASNYQVPETLVYQQIDETITANATLMRTAIVGPCIQVGDYLTASDKEASRILSTAGNQVYAQSYNDTGTYAASGNWATMGIDRTKADIDDSDIVVYAENPLLRYYSYDGTGSSPLDAAYTADTATLNQPNNTLLFESDVFSSALTGWSKAVEVGDIFFLSVSGIGDLFATVTEVSSANKTATFDKNVVAPGKSHVTDLYCFKTAEYVQVAVASDSVITSSSATPQVFTLNASLMGSGNYASLPLYSARAGRGLSKDYGTLYMSYVAYLKEASLAGNDIDYTKANLLLPSDTLNDYIAGPLSPSNPLKFALYKARENDTSNLGIVYVGVSNPEDISNWETSLDALSERTDVYNVVPLTNNASILAHCVDWVNTQSTAIVAKECSLWVNSSTQQTTTTATAVKGYFDSIDGGIGFIGTNSTTNDFTQIYQVGDVLKCTLDASNVVGTYPSSVQGTITQIYSTNIVMVSGITLPVLGSSTTTTSSSGTEGTSSSGTEGTSSSGTEAETTTDTRSAITYNATITRNKSISEYVDAIATDASAYKDNYRVRYIWPDVITVTDTDSSGNYMSVNGYYLCAALAALTTAVRPQQGVTRYAISGFQTAPRTTMFSRTQLNKLAVNGVWVVTESDTGTIFTRHALTTYSYASQFKREEMIIRNMDAVTKTVRNNVGGYIGTSNISQSNVDQIYTNLYNLLTQLRSAYYTTSLGGQIIDFSGLTVQTDSTYADRLNVSVNIELPSPLNSLYVYLTFSLAEGVLTATTTVEE